MDRFSSPGEAHIIIKQAQFSKSSSPKFQVTKVCYHMEGGTDVGKGKRKNGAGGRKS